jgi:cytochrome c6
MGPRQDRPATHAWVVRAVALGLSLAWLPGPLFAQSDGKEIFTSTAMPPCALCHTLAAAGASGEIGPNLDELRPDEDKVRRAVRGGLGNMPAYEGQLSAAEIDAVARYVASAAAR